MKMACVLIACLAVAAGGCEKARKAGSKAVDTGLSSVAEGTEKTVERFKDKYDQRAANWLKQTAWKVDAVAPARPEGEDMRVDVETVVRNTGTEKIDLVSILSRDLVMLTAADGVSHKVAEPRSGEIFIQPGTAIRQKISFRVVGRFAPKELTLVGCPPVPLSAAEGSPASQPALTLTDVGAAGRLGS
ncbi:MAG: hypothetical protein NT031_12445 [Planctomycetota bacterium]|nr:hypothetical protein [Planctomycetota bacterium]